VVRNDDHTRTGRNPTQYTTESQQLSLEPYIRQEHASPYTYTPRSSWRKTRYALTPRSPWRETRGHEQIPFKVVPNSSLNEMMKVNLEGFHPFTSEVMRAELPKKWKLPSLGKYNGTSDPEAHIKAYMTQANLFSWNMVIHCRLFPTTLMGWPWNGTIPCPEIPLIPLTYYVHGSWPDSLTTNQ